MLHSVLEASASTSAPIDNGQSSSGSTPAVRYETIVIHPYHGDFYKGILDDFVLTIHGKTGFANASRLCISGQKHYCNWIRNRSNLQFIETIKNEFTSKNEIVLYRINEGIDYNDINGTYVCEKILYRIAQWVSIDFSVKVSGILSNFYHNRSTNRGYENELKEQKKRIQEAYEEEIEGLKRDYEERLEDNKKTINDCVSKLKVCKEEIEEYKRAINDYASELEVCKEGIEGYKRAISDYVSELKVHKEEIEETKKDYEERIEGYKKYINDYVGELQICKEEIEDYKERNVYLQDKNVQLEEKIAQFEQQVVDMGVDYVPKLNYISKRPVFAIVDKGITRGFYKLIAIRTQELRFRTAFQRIRRKYPKSKLLFYSYHPNSITFLNQVRQQFPNIKTRYNDIHLPNNYSIVQFIKDIRKEFSKPPRTAALDAMEV